MPAASNSSCGCFKLEASKGKEWDWNGEVSGAGCQTRNEGGKFQQDGISMSLTGAGEKFNC